MVDRIKFESSEVITLQPSETIEKKPFVDPKISVPIDILEATTFFQSAESGATN